MARDNNVIDVFPVFFDHIFDPLNRQRQVVISEADDQNVFADNVVVHPFVARHVYGIFRDKLSHGVNPAGGVRVIEFVVTHYWQKFHALRFVGTRDAGPLFPFNRRAFVCQVTYGYHQIHTRCQLMFEHLVHRVHRHMGLPGFVRATLSIWQYAYRESTETRFFGDVFILGLLCLWCFDDWCIEADIGCFCVATTIVAIATTSCQCHCGSQQAQVSHYFRIIHGLSPKFLEDSVSPQAMSFLCRPTDAKIHTGQISVAVLHLGADAMSSLIRLY